MPNLDGPKPTPARVLTLDFDQDLYRSMLRPETQAALAERDRNQMSPFRGDSQRCKECDEPFRPCDSTGSDLGLCQNCWEALSANDLWKEVKDLEPTGYPDEYRRVSGGDQS